ncbi:tetratricopeptide repeat protein [Legionella oakridgensis]|uniref:Pilus MSHA type biogenesis protein n=2 Tax=Legionella oakridgensis TaxID=29423 RepID=W0BIE1_9GAMM|nr:tetratricopeptide repeat protein [Legionella oakridgensis]AHE68377.1 pilus MSHA type biogenesis protein [Legionella oakridgensis ATCC 33761 = DSM 21215]KTD38954.1 Anaphase-promoting complex, cyclosome, subunit 3 [Legionella oakridgensis]STY21318.1 Predicted O-linked N-acetylglucosamine transferase, SPINDLY family [Legionella longbeachae]
MSLLNEMLNDLNENKLRREAAPLFIPPQKQSFLRKLPEFVPWFLGVFIVSVIVLLILKSKKFSLDELPSTSQTVPGQKVTEPVMKAQHAEKPLPKPLADLPEQKQTFVPLADETMHSSLPVIPALQESMSSGIEDTDEEPAAIAAVNRTYNNLTAREWHDVQLNDALQAIQEGNDPRATRLLELILSKFPNSTEARESLAAIYLSHAQHNKAIQILDEGLEYEPDSLVLTMMKAHLLFDQDEATQALRLLERFNPDIRAEPDFYGLLAAVMQALGKMDEAGSLYKSLIAIEPSNGQYWLGYGIALEHKQAYQQAAIAYRRASQSYDIEPSVRAYAENRLKHLQG